MRPPRVTVLVALVGAFVVSTAGGARADSFLEVAGGMSIPLGDDAWTKLADTSAKLGARVGAVSDANGLGAMLQADWTPVNLNNSGGSFGNQLGIDIAGHDFRFLADLTLHHAIASRLLVSVRVGAGIELAHASTTLTIGTSSSTSDTNAGFAFEAGGGVWYSFGDVQVGGELAIPVAWHSKRGDGSDGLYPFDYTNYNIDLLAGVRVLAR